MFKWLKKRKEEKLISNMMPVKVVAREIRIGDVYCDTYNPTETTALVLLVSGDVVVYAQINDSMYSSGLHQCCIEDFCDKYDTECTPGRMEDIWPMVLNASQSTKEAVELAKKRMENAEIERRKIDESIKNSCDDLLGQTPTIHFL